MGILDVDTPHIHRDMEDFFISYGNDYILTNMHVRRPLRWPRKPPLSIDLVGILGDSIDSANESGALLRLCVVCLGQHICRQPAAAYPSKRHFNLKDEMLAYVFYITATRFLQWLSGAMSHSIAHKAQVSGTNRILERFIAS